MVRGIDRTGAMFRQMDKNMRKTMESQLRMQRVFANLAFVGAAMVTFGSLFAFALGRVLELSSLGALYMGDLTLALEKLGIAVSETIVAKFGWAIELLVDFIDALAEDQPMLDFIVTVGGIGLGVLIMGGFILWAAGTIGSLITSARLAIRWLSQTGLAARIAGSSFATLAGMVTTVLAGFLLGVQVGQMLMDVLGPMPTAIIGVAAALAGLIPILLTIAGLISISTGGLAALAGLAAFGVAVAGIGIAGLLEQQVPEGYGGTTPPSSMGPYPTPYPEERGRYVDVGGIDVTINAEGMSAEEIYDEFTRRTAEDYAWAIGEE